VRLPSRLTVLTATLLVLLPALAILQYQWVGQLGDAARDRMQRNLHNAAQQFRESFDGEIARAFISLQVDAAVAREQAWSRYAARYAAWASTTAFANMVDRVYLIDAQGRDLRLRRWDDRGEFVPAEWKGALAIAREHFKSELAAFAAGDRQRSERRLFREHAGLLIAPLVDIHFGPPPAATAARPLEGRQINASVVSVFGFTVIELNLPAIRDHILPALARRHFSSTDGDAYRVAVVDAAAPANVVFRSAPDVVIDPKGADVNVPIFGAHHDPLMFFARGLTREHVPPDRRNMIVSVLREKRDGGEVMMQTRMASSDNGRWRLLAQHERGSLEAAVGGMRQRNLLISFGILLLMGVSIGLLTLSSRRAQALAQQRMEFVAGVSHELRTPVAVIRSAGENLSHGVVGDPERVRRYGDAIQSEARRLGEMVERVLHFAGIESGRVVRSPVAVEPLVQEAIAAALAQSPESYTIERQIAADLPPVLGEPASLRSAIQNLVGNAMKYGGPDRWIRVRAEAGVRRGHRPFDGAARIPEVRITVEDHGRGVASADLPRIFDPFYRGADATERQIQGTGLGLALVRRIAQAHGGRVTVVTREGIGSAFTLHLPPAASMHDKPLPFQSPNEAAAR
jgi:signal transduction histidine kinase